MRRIAQISDLHFGAHDPTVVAALRTCLNAIRPDLVVVSGDVTQRARTRQFVEADAFLGALEGDGLKVLVVPGNHDVRAMSRPLARLFSPLSRYARIVARGRPAFFADEEMAVLGLTSAHGLTIKDGRLTGRQVRAIEACFAGGAAHATRILVTHHPLVPLPRDEEGAISRALRGAGRALAAVKAADVHLVLAGHHHAHAVALAGPMLAIDPQVMVVQAGTATSWRRRGTPNSFNMIGIAAREAVIEEWTSEGGGFSCRRRSAYARGDHGWGVRP